MIPRNNHIHPADFIVPNCPQSMNPNVDPIVI